MGTHFNTGPLWGESIGHRWIPLTKGQPHAEPSWLPVLAWISCWTNDRLAGDLRRRAYIWRHYNSYNGSLRSPHILRLWWFTQSVHLIHRGRDKIADISQTTFSKAFSWMMLGISLKSSLKFLTKVPINNITTLIQVMAWRRLGDKPLSEPMMVSLCIYVLLGLNELIYWGLIKLISIVLIHFPSRKFHAHLVLTVQLTICQHWFRQRFHAEQATSHYFHETEMSLFWRNTGCTGSCLYLQIYLNSHTF